MSGTESQKRRIGRPRPKVVYRAGMHGIPNFRLGLALGAKVRVEEGDYRSPAVLDTALNNLIESGDLGPLIGPHQ